MIYKNNMEKNVLVEEKSELVQFEFLFSCFKDKVTMIFSSGLICYNLEI